MVGRLVEMLRVKLFELPEDAEKGKTERSGDP
jgi:hypothetical protein